MTLVSDVRNIASELRRIAADETDIAEIKSGLSKVCREKGIDYGQLKALVYAQERDSRDGKHRVEKIVERADFASAYAEMLTNGDQVIAREHEQIQRNCSSSPAPVQETPAPEPVPVIAPEPEVEQEPAPATVFVTRATSGSDTYAIPSDGSIPSFLDRRSQAWAS